MAKQSFQEWREEQRQLYTGGSSAGNSQSSNTGSTEGTSGKQDFQAWREEQRQKYTGGSGQNTSAASGKSSGTEKFGWQKGNMPKGFVQNPLTFTSGIKPVDTRPRAVAQMRAPFEYAAQQRQKEAEIADLNQKYKQAYIDYNKARRAVEAAGKGRGTANYTTAKNKMDEADALVEAYKKRVEEAGGTLWTPTDWQGTVKWSTRAGLTSADNAIAKGLDWAFGGFADELRTLAGVTANDISPSLADDAAEIVTKAGRVINPNYTYGNDNFLRQYIEEGNRRINLQHEEAARAASDSKAAQTVGKYTEMVMNSLPMSAMALLSGGTSAAAQATTEALQAASTLANSSRAAQIVTPILKATADMAADPNWGFTFMSVVGDSYENALEDGASEEQASLYAILNAAYNATTEIGGTDDMWGGLQKLPKNIRDALDRADNSVLLQIVKGIPSEMSEEIIQGIGESGLKSIYKDVPLYSTTDEGAIINPNRMKEEAIGAAVVSAVLGGGQTAATAGAYAIENGRSQRRYRDSVAEVYGGSAADLVESGLESAPGTRSRVLAEEYKAKLDNGESLTPRELAGLMEANEEAIRTENEVASGGTTETAERAPAREARPGILERARAAREQRKAAEAQAIEEHSAAQIQYYEEHGWEAALPKELETKNMGKWVKARTAAILEEAAAAPQASAQRTQKAAEQVQSTQTQAAAQEAAPAQQEARTEQGTQSTRYPQGTQRPGGVLEAIYNGEVGQIKAIVQNGDKFTARVQMPDGRTRDVTEDRLTFDAGTQRMLDSVRPYEYGDEMLLSYRPEDNGGDFDTYVQAYTTAADIYGKQTAVTAEQAYESSRRNGGAGSVLTREQFMKAFNTGRSSKDARIQNSAARQRGEGKVYFGQDVDVGGERYKAASEDMVSSAELDVIKTLAKVTGTDVVFYQSEADMTGRYRGANGFMRNGTMYIDVNAGANMTTEESAVLLTAAHELTHYLRENNAEGYAQLRDFVMQHLTEDGVDIEKLAEQKVARENGLLPMDEAVEEVIADSCEMMLRDTKLPEIMAKEKPGLYKQIREWLSNFAEKLRKAFTGIEARHEEARAMMQYAEEMQQIWDNALAGAVRNAEAATENGTAAPNNETAAANNRTKNARRENQQLEEYEVETALYDALDHADAGYDNVIKVGRMPQFVRELTGIDGDFYIYRNHMYSNIKTKKEARAEGRYNKGEHYHGVGMERMTDAIMAIETPVLTINDTKKNGNPEITMVLPVMGASGTPLYAALGFYTPRHINGSMERRPHIILSIYEKLGGVVEGGREYRDLGTVIDEAVKKNRVLSYDKKMRGVLPVTAQHQTLGSITDTSLKENIAQFQKEVNNFKQKNKINYSMREQDEDLQKKYPRLNLNEDISELDSVPAIELTDGSILPIKDRERYRTHVSFIEGNRIDVDDLRSGGWIGNGVYDASFTSDTARYIEQQQAKKRVAELRGVPYDQFGDGNIRYSMRDVAEDDTADERRGRQESYAELRRQNEELKRRAEYWKGQTRTTKEATVRKADTDALARRLTEELLNTDAEDTVKEELKHMGDYIVQTDGRELSYAELKDWAAAIADHILSGSETEVESGMEDARRELLDYLKANKLKVNEREMLNLPEGWKRQHRRIRFSKDGLPIDTAWMELQEKFGEGAFPSSITSQSDMLFHIADMERAWQPVRGNPFENYMGEMRETVAQDILDTMLSDEIRQTAKTAADRARDRMNKAVAEERTRYNDMRSRMQERIQQVYQEGVARKQEAVAKEKAAKWKKVEQTRNYYQQMMQNAQQRRRENAGIKKYKDSVTTTAAQLTDWMLKNSAKEHVPEVLKKTVGDFLTTIDFTSRQQLRGGEETTNDRKFAAKLSALRDVLENQQKYMSGADTESALDVYIDMPSDMLEQVKEFIRIANKYGESGSTYTVNDMTAEELRHLDTLLTVLSTTVKKTNQLMANSRYGSVRQAAQSSIEELGKLGKQGKAAKTGLAAFGFWDNTTPFYAFQRFGDGGKAIFEGISKGWEQMAFNAKKIIDFTENLYTAKEARTWREETHEVEFENGDKFTITTAQLMSLHCLRKRAQAIGHLYGGGLRVGNIGKGLNEIAQTEHFKPNSADLDMLDSILTERQKEVADALQQFMVDTCGEWGNEVSMKRFGYRGFGEKNYFPIQTDSNDRPAVDPDAKANDMFRLLNLSATKALTINANNALVVSDIFEVFTDHASDMAKYNALALPILDALKWYNYKERTNVNGLVYTDTVQRSVETAYGRTAQKYVVTLLKDLNGKHEGGTSRSDAVTKRMVSNYKAAAVGANLRVAIQQPTAYVRAAQEIDAKYLAAALKPGSGKQSSKEMNKYSGIATWKGLGFVSTDIGRSMRSQIMHDESLADVAKEKAMFFAEKGDAVTWAALWRACKMETADRTKLHGDELCKATAERFREVILKTQVVDATITRSHNMRNQGILANITTSFMAEPTLSYNILLNAYADYRADMRKAGGSSKQKAAIAWQKNKGAIVKSMAVFIASSAATVLAASLLDAVRDDDDYETFAQKLQQALFGEEGNWMEGNLMQELLIYNKIPVIKDIAAIFRGEDVSRMDMQAITNLKKAWDIDVKMLSMALGAKDGEKAVSYNGQLTAYGVLAANLRAVSQLSGLPFYNAMRDTVALYNTVVAPFSGVTVQSYRPTTRAAIKSSYLNGFMSDEDAMAELMKQGVADDADQAFWIINDWNGDGSSSGKLEELYAAVKAEDTESYDALMQELTEHGVFKSKIQNNVKNQVREWYQGSDTERASISKQEALALLQKYGGKAERDAEVAVEQWTCEKVTGIAYGSIDDEFINGNISESRALELQAKYGYGDTSKQTAAEIAANKELAQAKVMQWKFEKDTGINAGGDSFTGIRDAYNAGRISKEEVYEYRIKYAGDTPEKAENTAYRYEWIGGEEAMKSITGEQARRYDKYVTGSGISKLDYWNIINGHSASTFKADYDSKGKVIANSKRAKLWEYIDSLSLTPEQKDKIAMVYFDDVGTKSWAKLEEAPWNNGR